MDPVVYAMYLYFLIAQNDELKELAEHDSKYSMIQLKAMSIILNIAKDQECKEKMDEIFKSMGKVSGVIDDG